ncbi:MAG: hypothetical protein WDM89_18490 [Rhizomicrobium sp.]
MRARRLLAAALASVSDNPRVDALIERQIALADLQIEDLKRDDALRRWSLRFANASAVMKVAFEVRHRLHRAGYRCLRRCRHLERRA